MTSGDASSVEAAIRAWLRNDRRLGIRHWAVPAARAGASPAGVDAPGLASAPDQGRPAAPNAGLRRAPSGSGGPAASSAPLPAEAAVAPFKAELGDDGLPVLCKEELSEAEAAVALRVLDEAHVRGCTRCGLHASRTQTVFGVGKARPEVVFVGEGPGADEDRVGEPFVGKAGQLLNRMIGAMTLTRSQVYICNVVKCRPPGNRTPTDEEATACSPFLQRQLAILRPRVIVALGRPAAQALLVTKDPIGRLRGRFHDFPPPALAHLGFPPTVLMPTFHPAYLLRSPQEKAKAWEDLKRVMEHLGIPIPGR